MEDNMNILLWILLQYRKPNIRTAFAIDLRLRGGVL